jgi:hypothetical protein
MARTAASGIASIFDAGTLLHARPTDANLAEAVLAVPLEQMLE